MPLMPQAEELNEIIGQVNPSTLNLLSERGKRIYFPKKGILSQTAEARACSLNATIGMALEDDGSTMCLHSIAKNVLLPPKDSLAYATGAGVLDLRQAWQKLIVKKNPSLGPTRISLPVVTSALTHGITLAGYFFVNPGDKIILPDLFWGNYRLILEHSWNGILATFPAFSAGSGFNIEGLREMLGAPGDRKIVLLNFPNNPTGYTPTIKEARAINEAIVEAAEAGSDVVVIMDDAYFGLVYEEGILRESMFAFLASAHDKILAVKIDGPTKEDYVWGLRIGFLTFGARRNSPEFYAALEAKLAGAVRGTISNASHLGQSLLLSAYSNPAYEHEKSEKYATLRNRYLKIREILTNHPEYADVLTPLPFNSGYFMCLRPADGIDAEAVRQLLITEYDTGVIVTGNIIRIAFASAPIGLIEKLFTNLYAACRRAANLKPV